MKKELPNKERARSLTFMAIKDKKLIRKPCEVCGELKVEAHHPDYYEPLNVMWLCIKHHHEWHKKNGFQKSQNPKFPQIRVDEETFKKLVSLAKKRKESIGFIIKGLLIK